MPKAKKILITTATREVTIYRYPDRPIALGYCRICGRESYFMGLDCAADFAGCGAFQLIESLQEGRIHAVESPNGHLLICRNSVSDSIAK